ncbi:MAG: radical SAM protein [Verrucomicrobiota bacterium]
MKSKPLQLPWTSETVPHAVLDILRGCNIRCRDCYNIQPDHIRPLAEIEAQLDALMRLRKLHSVSLVGGEITLHPELVEIVRRVRQRGLFVELFTNGLALNDDLLARLKQAGANVIFLHIETDQRRPDLPARATLGDLNRLREEKVALIAAHGIEAGLAVTAYPDKPDEVEEAVAFTLASPHLCYLLVTWWRDVSRMPAITGDLSRGMLSNARNVHAPGLQREIHPGQLCEWLEQRFGITPFAILGSNLDLAEPRWMSFLTATVHRDSELIQQHSLRPTWVEKIFLAAARKLTGRYPFYQKQNSRQTGFHLLFNGLAGGSLGRQLKLLGHATRPGARLAAKRLLFQWPATVDASGRVVHCACCPDAVLKDGHLVPLCISDLVTVKRSHSLKITAVPILN